MRHPVITAAALLAAVGVVATTGLAASAAPKPHAVAADVITFAAYGDSITKRPDSWLNQLDDPGLQHVGGYANNGYTSAMVLAQTVPVPEADVAVIMLGTNDITQQVPQATVCSNIVKISEKSQARHTLVMFLPPSDVVDDPTTHVNRRVEGITMNRTLVQCAADHGYMYADAFSMARAWTNAWGTNNAVDDGVHPTTATQAKAADRMSIYIRQAAGGSAS